MKQANGWKRAGCVLLAAQISVSALPMTTMAAYVSGAEGRSGAILKAGNVSADRHDAALGESFSLDKGWLPMLDRRRLGHNTRSAIAPFTSVMEKALLAKETGLIQPVEEELDASRPEDVTTMVSAPDILPVVIPETVESGMPPVDPIESGVETPSVDPTEPDGEMSPVDPTEPGEETPPVDPIEPDGETPPVDPTEPGGEMPPVDPTEPGEETPPVDPTEPGEETPPVDPTEPGEEMPPVDPTEPGEGTPSVDPTEPGGETPPPADPAEPGVELPPVAPTPPTEIKVVTDSQSLRAAAAAQAEGEVDENICLSLNLYGYNNWATYTVREEYVFSDASHAWRPDGSAQVNAPPYQIESAEASPGGIKADGTCLEDEGSYCAYPYLDHDGLHPEMEGANDLGQPILELGSLELGRIPDLQQEGWIFAQNNPNPDILNVIAGGTIKKDNERAWVTRYDNTQPSDPYEPDLDALMAHGDPTLGEVETQDWGFPVNQVKVVTNVAAKWVPSSRADLTALQLYGWTQGKSDEKAELALYGEDFTAEGKEQRNQTPVALETYEDASSFHSAQEYYLQVSANTDRLTMDFTSYEPGTMIKIHSANLDEDILYRYDREGYVWLLHNEEVSPEEYAKRNAAPEGSSPLKREQPGRRTSGVKKGGVNQGQPTNSVDDPARALWSLPEEAAIPLNFTDPDHVYNDIVITVVAPDGTIDGDGTVSGTTATYTLHVRRMADPEITLNPGNTPYGVVDSISRTNEEKEQLRGAFDNRRHLDDVISTHNGAGVYKGTFGKNAWANGEDYDTDPVALVVYQDSQFEDPGFHLVDSQGKPVNSTSGLKRSIKLKQIATLSTDAIQSGAGNWAYYQSGGLVPDNGAPVEVNVTTQGGKDRLDLRGQRVLPGVYSMEYSFHDPASDEIYNSTDLSVYNDPNRAANFSRPLIVLPKPGDVDMDGMVTIADGFALERFLADPNSFLYVDNNDPTQRLFRYRVCDVDGDGQVTTTDVAKLKSEYVASQPKGSPTDYFYLNSVDDFEQGREPLTSETTPTGRAEISVEYLGKNLDSVPTGVMNTAEVELGDTFWVGIKLSNAAALAATGNGLKGFEFTLVYDKERLEPGALKDHTGWRSTLLEANLSTAGTTPWGGAYTLLEGSGPKTDGLRPHPELAIPTLRSGSERALGAYTVALELTAGQSPAALQDGYLLYIPFKMIKHPAGVSHDKVAMIEPAMGGRELAMVTTAGDVYAWSTREPIFGGVTANLKTTLAYVGAQKIPVGEDRTPRVRLYDDNTQKNAAYGEGFTTSALYTSDDTNKPDLSHAIIDESKLPPGMKYDPTGLGRIYTDDSALGATRAGVYQFYVDDTLCEIVVDKAPLTLTVESLGTRYYGEQNPPSESIGFRYNVDDLKSPDLARAISQGLPNNGYERQLVAILDDDGYVRPTVTTVDANGAPLTKKTPVGENYVARLTGGESTNYTFRYMRQGESAPNNEESTNRFRVIKRPIKVGIPTGPVAERKSVSDFDDDLLLLSMTNGDGVADFVPQWPDDRTEDGMMNGGALTGSPLVEGDRVTVSYTGIFQPIAQYCPQCKQESEQSVGDTCSVCGIGVIVKKDNSFTDFVLEEGALSEPRKVKILSSTVKLTGENMNNYRIDDSSPILTEGAMTTGTVVREPVVKLELTATQDLQKEYTYGDMFTTLGLNNVKVTWENGYSEPGRWGPNDNRWGIKVAWVDAEGALPDTGIPAVSGEYVQVQKHNNKWLCVYINNAGDVSPACAWVGPIAVKKADLKLTVAPERRYYGEPSPTSARITYEEKDLAPQDKAYFVHGLGEELVGKLDGYTAPTVTRRMTASVDGTTVTDKTDAGSYFVVISQAVADNYNILYAQAGQLESSGTFGYAGLTIDRRPIRVERITGKVGFLYDDATSKVLEKVEGTVDKSLDQGFDFELALPTGDYYPPGGSNDPIALTGSLTGSALVAGDSIKLSFRANFVSDQESSPFFDLTTFPAGADAKDYDVTVDRVLLDAASGAGRNYQLVFTTTEKAFYGYPEATQRVDNGGEVVIRRIERLEIAKLPDFMGDYTYGDGLELGGDPGLVVRVHYARGGAKDVRYSAFEENGLTLEWADENGEIVPTGGERAYAGQMMTVSDHNGRYLVVRGKRADNHEEKTVVATVPVTVVKKKIEVQAKKLTKVYGEENMSGTGTCYRTVVDWNSALIESDLQKLIDAGYTDLNGDLGWPLTDDLSITTTKLGEPAESPALSFLDPTFKGPVFATPTVNKLLPVGTYPLYLTGGEMANYEFACKDGEVEVRKRRIYLSEVIAKRGYLATMVAGSDVKIMDNVTATTSPDIEEVFFGSAGRPDALPQHGGVLSGDTVTVKMTVSFNYDRSKNPGMTPTLLPGEVTAMTWVDISNVKLVEGGDSYELVEHPDDYRKRNPIKQGRLDGRTIDYIELSASSTPKLSYNYGEALYLDSVRVDIHYKTVTGESAPQIDEGIAVGGRMGLSAHYLPTPGMLLLDPERLANGELGPEAVEGDHLTIATDLTGFAHQGKYLAISVKEKDPENPDAYRYPAPILVSEQAIQITPKPLVYTVAANDKVYDGTTVGSGTAWVEVNQIYKDPDGNSDVVYLVNGESTDPNRDMTQIPQEGARYRFDSGSYGAGLSFTFTDPNVAYEETPTHDHYGVIKTIPVAVSGVTMAGRDAQNYTIVGGISGSDSAAPQAKITRAERPAPSVADLTTMSTDIHTNTVTVTVDADPLTFGDSADAYNGELHFEYALEHLFEEGNPDTGFAAPIDGGDSPFFGGEKEEEHSEEFTPGEGEEDTLTPGMGQDPVAGDKDFGTRASLPRDTYFRARVRLAQTHNYNASEYTVSVSDADMAAAVAAARDREESDDIGSVSHKPEEIEPPRPIPEAQRLGKTYQYRFVVIAAQTMRDTEGEERVRTQLDSVWFADRATYPTEDYLNALTTSATDPRYYNYTWDARGRARVSFPLDMTKEIKANLTQPDGSTQEKVVNSDGNARLYTALVPRKNSGFFFQVEILSENIVATVQDEPIQLEARVTPVSDGKVGWRSSDETVVKVDKNGLLTFIGVGAATVTATYAEASDSIRVTVLPGREILPEGFFNKEYLDAFMELTDDLLFYPENTISRGELARILAKFIYPTVVVEEEDLVRYDDVSQGMDCAHAVEILSALGIFTGVGENRFAPGQETTRAEMAAILVRLGALPAADPASQSFVDAGPGDTWAWAEIEALAQAGITNGTGDYCFSPHRLLTRAETAAFLSRMLQYKLDLDREGLRYPVDVEEEYWAWREILQAVNGADKPEESETE